MGKLLHNMDIQFCCFLAGIYIIMYVCICLVARINQRVCDDKVNTMPVPPKENK